MNFIFRQAASSDKQSIWSILQQAIARRKKDGSRQWQDGYPNEDVVEKDIQRGIGYVLTADEEIAAYAAVILNDEPAYAKIVGTWLTDGDFYVVHRIAVSDKFSGQGLGKRSLNRLRNLLRKMVSTALKWTLISTIPQC
jgi:GNAT superfamily N-acetyltransferase